MLCDINGNTVSLGCGILYGILEIVVIQMFRDIKYMVSLELYRYHFLPIMPIPRRSYSRLLKQSIPIMRPIIRPISCDSFSRIVRFRSKDLLDPLLQCTVHADFLPRCKKLFLHRAFDLLYIRQILYLKVCKTGSKYIILKFYNNRSLIISRTFFKSINKITAGKFSYKVNVSA